MGPFPSKTRPEVNFEPDSSKEKNRGGQLCLELGVIGLFGVDFGHLCHEP